MLKEIFTNPNVIIGIVIALTYLISEVIRYKAEKNPEQDAWDEVYKVSKRIVAWVEQNVRYTKGSKLNSDDRTQLKTIAVNKIIEELDPKIEKEIMRHKKSNNIFKQILGTVVDAQVLKLKNKISK